ncbi:acetylglutamate kinase [Novimethylophilus kurashikiensis]|uniref:Acetylglutamate kinase n=1 Tax=Novimethylophilus kurashikiensis TaxID=1825523 RepID=A0A2R5FC17_9PROT|nr:hypothetical protein [Novimethylophilus kurashikiensis]GBG14473.1 acetylglutamate kinase [Novimethylophilus kurashikiensis]
MLNIEQINAVNVFANRHGRKWRLALHTYWSTHKIPAGTSKEEAALLMQVRNQDANLLVTFKPSLKGYEKVGKLVKGRHERYNLKRGWFVNAWRIVDEEDKDLVQPWTESKSDARALAKSLNIYLLE